jgi:hypothetical protein|eukprot:g1220.t1
MPKTAPKQTVVDAAHSVISSLRQDSKFSYKWNKKEWYTGRLINRDSKSSGKYWWTVVWDDDGSQSRVNLNPASWQKGNWALLTKGRPKKRVVRKKEQRAPATKTTKEGGESTLSQYELERLKNIEENKAELERLGIGAMRSTMVNTPRSKARKLSGSSRPRRQLVSRTARVGYRQSRRLKGKDPSGKAAPRRKLQVNFEAQAKKREEETYKELVARWKNDKKLKATGGDRQLFMVPTGVLGYNDHTLEEEVPSLGTYLWGFAKGLYSRIFAHINPGDILLFTSGATGKFNRIGVAAETYVVNQSECDKFWQRMDYNMGSGAKTNVGFPLLVPLKGKPVQIDWDKRETLALCGYSDRLQSSRRILMDLEGSRLVRARCEKRLGL